MAGFSEKAFRRIIIIIVCFLIGALLCLSSPLLFGSDNSSDIRSLENDQEDPPVLHEGFILLQTGRYTGDSFYRVLMDDEEQPYLNISDVLEKWLEMSTNCDFVRKKCHAVLHVKNQTFWIDGASMEYGDNLDNENGTSLPQQILVFQENKLWLRHDFWSQWTPVDTAWNLQEYKLKFVPQFPTKSELQRARTEIRNAAGVRLQKKQEIDVKEAIKPQAGIRPELRYRIGTEHYTKTEEKQTWLNIDSNTDLWQGTLKISASKTKADVDGESIETDVTIWNYRRLYNPYFHLLELGNMGSDSSLLIPRNTVENGLKLHRLDNSPSSDRVGFSGSAPPGTEIDLYYFGFIQKSVTVGSEGTYNFDEISVPGGDRIRLKFYYPDGSSEEKIIQVAPDNGWLIPDGDWNSRLFTGTASSGNLSRFDLGYGFTEDFSLGLQANRIALEDVDPVSLYGAYMVWRPVSGLYLLTEALTSKPGADTAASVEITHFYPQFISYAFHRLTESSPLLDALTGDTKSTEFDKATYSVEINSAKNCQFALLTL